MQQATSNRNINRSSNIVHDKKQIRGMELLIFSFLSIVTLVLSFAVHIITFMPTSRLMMSDVWPLHIGAIIVFGMMVISLARDQKKKRSARRPGESYFTWLSNSKSENQKYLAEIIRSTPIILRILCITVFIYTMINFALFIKHSEGGGPSEENGRYYLTSHGRIIRELSEQEYHRFCLYELRGFSGHWILFSLLPTVYFLTIRKDRNIEQNRYIHKV
jgi:hypothetical protein